MLNMLFISEENTCRYDLEPLLKLVELSLQLQLLTNNRLNKCWNINIILRLKSFLWDASMKDYWFTIAGTVGILNRYGKDSCSGLTNRDSFLMISISIYSFHFTLTATKYFTSSFLYLLEWEVISLWQLDIHKDILRNFITLNSFTVIFKK